MSTDRPLARRTVLKSMAAGAGALALAGGGWTPAGRVTAAAAVPGAVPLPPDVPSSGGAPYLQVFRNWAGDVVTERLWTIDCGGEAHVVQLANWAHANGFTLRPRGFMHNWSPLTVANGASEERVLLVNTRRGITGITFRDYGTVTAGAGASLEDVLFRLELRNRGLAHHPAPGDITIGGALAIGAHGTAVPARGESRATGHSYGSLANLVSSLRAVVWDPATSTYVAREFSRSQQEAGALMVHLGRAFITQVTLRVGPLQKMRCQSFTTIRASELLAAPGSSGRTVARLLDQSGRMEIIWFPFTQYPWLKVWTLAWLPPLFSIPTITPYNYPFADGIFGFLIDNPRSIYDNPASTPAYSQKQATGAAAGLVSFAKTNIWGSGRNVMLYVRPSTMRVTANGYAILCKRADVQWVLHTFTQYYEATLAEYAARGQYPVNGPVEIRVTGVDNPGDTSISGAVDPWLAPTRRRPDRPDWDCAVWLDLLTLPFTPGLAPFYAQIEQWLFATFESSRTTIRVEWSKGWAYSQSGAYQAGDVIDGRIPTSLSAGQPAGTRYADAAAMLNRLDPHRIYTSPLLDRLLP